MNKDFLYASSLIRREIFARNRATTVNSFLFSLTHSINTLGLPSVNTRFLMSQTSMNSSSIQLKFSVFTSTYRARIKGFVDFKVPGLLQWGFLCCFHSWLLFFFEKRTLKGLSPSHIWCLYLKYISDVLELTGIIFQTFFLV